MLSARIIQVAIAAIGIATPRAAFALALRPGLLGRLVEAGVLVELVGGVLEEFAAVASLVNGLSDPVPEEDIRIVYDGRSGVLKTGVVTIDAPPNSSPPWHLVNPM